MSDKYAVNTKVEWEWGSGTGQGKIREVFTERVSRTIKVMRLRVMRPRMIPRV
jgi:Hypervirulence associated proteins TUDOR domain